MRRFAVLSVIFLLLSASNSHALTFGKNRIRVDRHEWYVAETEHFEIYHYEESKELMTDVGSLAEEAYDRVAEILDYYPSKKSPLFLYLTQNHFDQTNIANAEGAGGFAEAFKNRFVLPVTGSKRRLKHIINHEFTHVVCFYIWYGDTFWKSMSLLKSFFYPMWVIEGVAEYVSGHYDDLSYADMILRDAATSGLIIPLVNLQNFGALRGYQRYLAYKESESAIRYISEKYGRDKVSRIIAMYRKSTDSNSVLQRAVNNNLVDFDREWQGYIHEKYAGVSEKREEAESYGEKITGESEFNTSPVFSPNGEKLAFISNRKGYNDIVISNDNGSRQRSLLNTRIGSRLEHVYASGHALSWSPDGEKIAFAGRKNYKDYICIVNARGRRLNKIPIPLDCVSSPCYSHGGDKIVFVGMKNGVNDLWLLDLNQSSIRQLTFDENDDDYPVFSPDDSRIAWVSEHNMQKDLYVLDLEKNQIKQLTDTPCYEIHPEWSRDGGQVYFISDPDGFYNMYRMDVVTRQTQRLTNVITGVFKPAISRQGDKIACSVYRRGEKNIYISELEKLEAINVTEKEPLMARHEEREEESGTVTSPEDISPVTNVRKYKFKPSTDLFFPIPLPDFEGGVLASGIWQLSDMLGNHNLGLEGVFTNTSFITNREVMNIKVSYVYRGLKPNIGIYYSGIKTEVGNSYINEYRKMLLVDYPLSRFNRISAGAELRDRSVLDVNNILSENNYLLGSVSLIRDTTQGKMLDILSGYRANLSLEKSLIFLGGESDYSKIQLEAQKYFTIRNLRMHDYHVLALRFWGGMILGDEQYRNLSDIQFNTASNPLMFRIKDLISEAGSGNSFSLFNAELRMMILPAIDYHMWYFWPNIYVKNLQLVIFVDSGRTWKDGDAFQGMSGFITSIGAGVRLNMFLLEKFPIVLRFDYSARLDNFAKTEYRFLIGPTF